MDIEPLFSRIIVKRKEVTQVGSIVLPQGHHSLTATEGEVLAVGPECDVITKDMKVYFGKYSGAEIEREGQKYIVMNEEDVLGIVK